MSTEVAVADGATTSRFEASLDAEHEAERDLMKALARSILLTMPVTISDKTEWYVWLSLGVGLGVIGGVLMGSLAGATMNAHKLDEVDRHTYGA